jgi:hypothetical protein
MTKKQQQELDCLKWFWPELKYTNEEAKEYFDYDVKGGDIPKDNPIYLAKQWRGRTIHELWEQGILDGSVPYFVLLGGEDKKEIPPRKVVDFIKREIFKGIDANMIEKVYQEICLQYKKVV